MELADIAEVRHEFIDDDVNKLISTGWVILAVSPGQDNDGRAYVLYSLGRANDPYRDVI